MTDTKQTQDSTKFLGGSESDFHGYTDNEIYVEEIDLREQVDLNPNENESFHEASHKLKRISIIFAAILIIFSLIIYTEQFIFSSDVLPSVNVGGIEFGTNSKSETKDKLEKEIKKALATPITINLEGKSVSISPQDIDLKYDLNATLKNALDKGKSLEPIGATTSFFGRHFANANVKPTYSYNKISFETVSQNISNELSTGRTDASIEIKDLDVTVQKAVAGSGISQSDVKAVLINSIDNFNEKKINLKKKKVEAKISLSEANKKAAMIRNIFSANTVLSTPAGNTITITPTQIASALKVVPNKSKLDIVIDEELLRAATNAEMSAAEVAPVDATWSVNGNVATVVPSISGKVIDLKKAIKEIVSGKHEIAVDVIEKNPKHDTAWANSLNIHEQVSTFTTNFPAGQERVKNITRAAQVVNNTVVEPNEIFSLNNKLGKRTAENGYVKAPVFSSEDGFFEDYGGGASQFTTTMFNAVWFGGYKDIEHAPHSIYISRYPMGREATLNWGSIDLKFQNDSKSGILVKTYVGATSVTVSFYGDKEGRSVKTEGPNILSKKPIEKEYTDDPTMDIGKEKETEHGYEGMTVENIRIISRPGQADKRERYTWTYIMVKAKVLRGTKQPVAPPA